MKIVADTNIPFLKGVLEPYAEVVYMDGRSIGHEAMVDADAIIMKMSMMVVIVIMTTRMTSMSVVVVMMMKMMTTIVIAMKRNSVMTY